MRLRRLIKGIAKDSAAADFEVKGISCNSKSVKEGFVFAAIKGNRQDGADFIDEAIRNGAKAVVAETAVVRRLPPAACIKVRDARRALAQLASRYYGDPSRKVKVVGITGTNGKTTITYLIERILKESARSAGVIGTINSHFKNSVTPSKNTTPGPVQLQALLARMRKAGINYCLMEVSSHALHQDRVGGINFHSAIFTNLTQDHLDYHRTLAKYFLAKARLFKLLSPPSFAVINNDDPYGRKLKKMTRAEVITYGINKRSAVAAQDIALGIGGTEFRLVTPRGRATIKTHLIGRHNIYNLLAAAAWAQRAGVPISDIKNALEDFRSVPGRLQRINSDKGFSVFVDYAHTEDALKNVITALRPLCAGRLIVLFGCGGERDKTKRPKMGRVVTELADFAVITSDNPRSEKPLEIIRDIRRGIKRDNFCVVPERGEAIRKALLMARPKDMVILAGKGHEDYQVFKNRSVHFDDREEARRCLG